MSCPNDAKPFVIMEMKQDLRSLREEAAAMSKFAWLHDPDLGFKRAKSARKLVLLDFSAAPQ